MINQQMILDGLALDDRSFNDLANDTIHAAAHETMHHKMATQVFSWNKRRCSNVFF